MKCSVSHPKPNPKIEGGLQSWSKRGTIKFYRNVALNSISVGQVPFVGENAVQIYENIIRGQIDFPQSVRDAEGDIQYIQVSPWARDIITGLLKVDRTRRLGNMRNGAQDVQNHPWVSFGNFFQKFFYHIFGVNR